MENKIQPEAMEQQLAEQFANSNLSKTQLSSASRYVAALQKAGINIHDIFPNGQPQIRSWILEGQLDVSKVANIPELLANKIFKEIHLFRKGVPVPILKGAQVHEFFTVKAVIEER
jgi:hypothetical protein